ncbi:MAG TPA: hypothetical protein VJ741_12070 [Solirubrobacteraceae bacterium]|nr:hypothetical protein [Solirubrobacteraceae bacterium]
MSTFVRSRRRVFAILVAALASLGVLIAPSVAFASNSILATCQTPAVSTPFSQWGDNNDYFLAPGGSFEGTADQVGWTLSNATLTSGNEPFLVNSPGDSQSLTIAGGGSATSPYFCVDNTMSSLRFFAQQVGAGAGLRAQALVQTSDGVTTVPLVHLLDGSTPTWAPTAPIVADNSGLADGQTLMVALQFTVRPSAATWQIDDVYVDPYRSG